MRTVGMTGKNLLNVYYTMLALSLEGGCGKIAPDENADVAISTAPALDSFCVEPVKSINSSVALTKAIYFVPAFDFAGIEVNASNMNTAGVEADGQTLYKLAAGATVTKVSM